jgi:hypothetical protein
MVALAARLRESVARGGGAGGDLGGEGGKYGGIMGDGEMGGGLARSSTGKERRYQYVSSVDSPGARSPSWYTRKTSESLDHT